MIRVLLFFVLIFALFFFVINAFRDMTGMEQWRLTKLVAYSTMCAVLTIMVLTAIVIIF